MKTMIAILATLVTLSAHGALKVGETAPDFTTQASLGGNEFTFSLSQALKSGPVVLYFYPAAFTQGCTIEAHVFAEAMDQYKALGATVIGVSHDPIETLKKFSISECRSKFSVAADGNQGITKSYDAVLSMKPEYADRTSYVIVRGGKIIYTFTDLTHLRKHVENTLKALRTWRAQQKN